MIANEFLSSITMPAPDRFPADRALSREDGTDAGDAQAPSKTRRKKDMQALQDLGARLVELDPSKLATLGLPERLSDAIRQLRSITKHEARRRQVQFIGRLMRDVDPEPLRAALDRDRATTHAERAQFAAAERWRDRLLQEEDAVDAFVAAHPRADGAKLAALVVRARAERVGAQPPHASRALFRLINAHLSSKSA